MVKLRIEIGYLEGVEDPEASTLFHNLGILGYDSVEGLKIYKIYQIDVAGDNEHGLEVATQRAN